MNSNNEYSFNNYKNKNIRNVPNIKGKNIILKLVVVSIIFTIVFFIICFIMESPTETSTVEECRTVCNGSFSLSNGKCVCSYKE